MIFTASDVSSLAASLERWEWAEYFACALVALGCTGEYIAEFTNSWTGGLKEKKDRLAKRSTLLLISALALELICLVRTNSISGLLIGSLSDKAGIADTKAQSALDKSSIAETRANLSVASSASATVAAAEAQRKIGGALTALSELQARIAWRTVSEEQRKKLRDKLQAFRGRTISLSWDSVDAEQNTFGPQLFEAFRNAGLTVKPDVAALSILPPAEMAVTGILIEGSDDGFMEGLAKALVCSSLAQFPIPMVRANKPDGSVEIRIRSKGPQIITKNDAKCKA